MIDAVDLIVLCIINLCIIGIASQFKIRSLKKENEDLKIKLKVAESHAAFYKRQITNPRKIKAQ